MKRTLFKIESLSATTVAAEGFTKMNNTAGAEGITKMARATADLNPVSI